MKSFAILTFIIAGLSADAQYYNLQGFWRAQTQGPWYNYNPAGGPVAREDHTMVWTGTHALVWGGQNSSYVNINTGAAYDPITNTWSTITTTGAPSARKYHSAHWTGSRMLIWGGWDGGAYTNDGASYDPGTNSWTNLTSTGAPTIRGAHYSVWTGSQMLIWGGFNGSSALSNGSRYNPTLDSWSAITATGAPSARASGTAVWTGTKMIVWGGSTTSLPAGAINSGGLYDPAADSWSATSSTSPPTARVTPQSAWTGTQMIIWGGMNASSAEIASGKLYDPAGAGTWSNITTTTEPAARIAPASAWTGQQFFVWGGRSGGGSYISGGGLYSPTGNTWVATSSNNEPSATHANFTTQWAVWTGSRVLLFGGVSDSVMHAYDITPPVVSLAVAKVYPTNGSNWLDYVKNFNGGTNPHNQKDEACAGTETGNVKPCLHAGEKLKVQVTNATSCHLLTATDALGAFDWSCEDQTGTVSFYSNLKVGKGLSDLIDLSSAPGTWRSNSVTVKKSGVTIGTTGSSTWWTNTIASLPATNTGTGSAEIALTGYAAGTILTVQANQQTSGFNINQDKIAIVTANNATLTYNSRATPNCDWTTGENTSASMTALICSGGQKYIWVEGNYATSGGSSTAVGLEYFNTRYSRLNKFRMTVGSQYENIYIYNSPYNVLTDVHTQTTLAGWHSISFEGSSFNYVDTVSVHNQTTGNNYAAIGFVYSDYNFMHNLKASNTASTGTTNAGIFLDGSLENTITRVVAASGNDMGFAIRSYSGNSQYNTAAFVTAVNMTGYGGASLHDGNSSRYTTYNNFLLANSGAFINVNTSDQIFSQLAIANGTGAQNLRSEGATNAKFTNNILIGPNTSSQCAGTGTSPGVVNGGCGNQNSSDANWVLSASVTAASSFVGKVVSNDSINPSDSSGSQSFASITDWTNFDNFYRAWGKDGSAFPNANNIGTCTSGTCRIWDLRLSASDTVFRNRTGNGTSANNAFVAGAACPTEVTGNKTLTDQRIPANVFLVNAMEILNDDFGDDDGLCESFESCLYAPNFGAYQGEGDYLAAGTCLFQNGTVKNVKMYAYPTNGG